jgi:hypothetical protein
MASEPVAEEAPHNRDLELSEMVVVGNMTPNTANSVYKIQRQLFARSERVKGIDFHPVEPWILTTLYSGTSGRMEYEELRLIKMPHRTCLHLVIRDSGMPCRPLAMLLYADPF